MVLKIHQQIDTCRQSLADPEITSALDLRRVEQDLVRTFDEVPVALSKQHSNAVKQGERATLYVRLAWAAVEVIFIHSILYSSFISSLFSITCSCQITKLSYMLCVMCCVFVFLQVSRDIQTAIDFLHQSGTLSTEEFKEVSLFGPPEQQFIQHTTNINKIYKSQITAFLRSGNRTSFDKLPSPGELPEPLSTREVALATGTGGALGPTMALLCAGGIPGVALGLTLAGVSFIMTYSAADIRNVKIVPPVVLTPQAPLRHSGVQGQLRQDQDQVRMMQHQRAYLGNWSNRLLTTDSLANFTTHDEAKSPLSPHNVTLPEGYSWEGKWHVHRSEEDTDADGWRYAGNFKGRFAAKDEMFDSVRSRIWVRTVGRAESDFDYDVR